MKLFGVHSIDDGLLINAAGVQLKSLYRSTLHSEDPARPFEYTDSELQPAVLEAVCSLPMDYNRDAVLPILKRYGTHVITDAALGRVYTKSIANTAIWSSEDENVVARMTRPIYNVVRDTLYNINEAQSVRCSKVLQQTEQPLTGSTLKRIRTLLVRKFNDYTESVQSNVKNGE